MSKKRAWADIYLNNIKTNFDNICNRLPKGVKHLAVIKADAYGHGALQVANYLEGTADFFAVATAEEAIKLTDAGISTPILILGHIWPLDYLELIKAAVRIPIYTYTQAQKLSDIASFAGIEANVHIKVDTGMHRIGFAPTDENAEIVRQVRHMPGLNVEGIFTHFSTADETDKSFTLEQYKVFTDFIAKVEEGEEPIKIHHCANSAASMELPQLAMDMVRVGIALYGLYPSSEVSRDIKLLPAMELHSSIVNLNELHAGDAISYNRTKILTEDKKIATIPVGYADGYPRLLSNEADVIIRGKRARIQGRICMDQFMCDVTDIPEVSLDDTVTLVGNDGNELITIEELSDICGRFNYEFICNIGDRFSRIYHR